MSSKWENFLVAAVDIGTTYSGSAFSLKNEFNKDPIKVSFINLWSDGYTSSLKTSTCVLCNPRGEFDSFGYEAEYKYADLAEMNEHHKWYFILRFKMVLYEKQIKRTIEVEDDKGLKMPARKVFGMAIGYLKKHLLDTLVKREIGLKADEIHWILTVPAIWTKSAKLFMREAAEEILNYTEVENLNQSRQVKIDKAEELVLFLQFEHDVGNIVFFLYVVDYYWVPCMVHTTAPDNIKTLGDMECVTKTSTLCFESKTKFIHIGLFHRLLASCLSKWKPAKIGEKYLVFIGLCMLQLDHCHNLMLSLNDFVIQATVMRHTSKGVKPDLSLCIQVKEHLNSSLSEISKYLCPNSEFEVCITCSRSSPQTDGDRHKIGFLRENKEKEIRCISHAGLHSSSEELLGYWEIVVGREGKKGQLPSERHLDFVAGELGVEWCFVALHLGLSLAEIQQIESNSPGNVRRQIFTALTTWSHRSDKDDRDKVCELLNAVKKEKRNDLATQLKEKLNL